MDTPSLELLLQQRRTQVATARALEISARQNTVTLDNQLQSLRTELAAIEEAAVILAAVTDAKRKELKEKVENFVSMALTRIFETNMQFIVDMSQEGNQISAHFLVKTDDLPHPVDLFEARGGGLVQVVGFILRIVILLSHRPPLRRLLVMDEPFRMVSEQYVDNLTTLVRELAYKTKIQFVIVTHDKSLADLGDKAYEFTLKNGSTTVEALQST